MLSRCKVILLGLVDGEIAVVSNILFDNFQEALDSQPEPGIFAPMFVTQLYKADQEPDNFFDTTATDLVAAFIPNKNVTNVNNSKKNYSTGKGAKKDAPKAGVESRNKAGK